MARRVIKAKEIVADIRARLTDFELMEKYQVTLEGLHKVFDQLVKAGALRPEELEERTPFFDDPANRSKTRAFPRKQVDVPLPIYDSHDSAAKGIVKDLSEKGIRIEGITAMVGESKTFLIPADIFPDVDPIGFEAKCRWVEKKGADKGLCITGFEITGISDDSSRKLRKLIEKLSFQE